jgi:hypothetical protein
LEDVISVLLWVITTWTASLPLIHFVQKGCGGEDIVNEFREVDSVGEVVAKDLSVSTPVDTLKSGIRPSMPVLDVSLESRACVSMSDSRLVTGSNSAIANDQMSSCSGGHNNQRAIAAKSVLVNGCHVIRFNVQLSQEREAFEPCCAVLVAFNEL